MSKRHRYLTLLLLLLQRDFVECWWWYILAHPPPLPTYYARLHRLFSFYRIDNNYSMEQLRQTPPGISETAK